MDLRGPRHVARHGQHVRPASADCSHGTTCEAGEYREAATPADIAPTLAALSGIAMPRAEGHVLRAALVTPPRGQILVPPSSPR